MRNNNNKNNLRLKIKRSRYIRKRIKVLKEAINTYENMSYMSLSYGDIEYANLCDKKIVDMYQEIDRLKREQR